MIEMWLPGPFRNLVDSRGVPFREVTRSPDLRVLLYSETIWPQFQDVSGTEEQPMTEALNQEVSPLPCLPLSSL